MKIFASAAARRRVTIQLAVVAGFFGGLYLLVHYVAPEWTDPVFLRQWIRSFGVLAPIVFIAVQIVQVVVAPVPGQLTALVGGYLFGPVWGTFYSLVGVAIGSAIAFHLAKRYGRPYVERVLDSGIIHRFDDFTDRAGVPGLFAFALIPGLPDDAVCFLLGLTRIKFLPFLAIMTVGRLPAFALTTMAGGNFATGRIIDAFVLLGLLGIISLVVYAKHEWLIARLTRVDRRE